MTRYFGVNCVTCEKPIPLAICETGNCTKVTLYVVPLESLFCRKCGSSHRYASADSMYFDGLDGLLDPL
jgi:hypothetical protein